MKERIREYLKKCGAIAVGFAKSEDISPEVQKQYQDWIGEGCHGEMQYLERHATLRINPDQVLKGCKTLICLAFNYSSSEKRAEELPYLSSYAYGEDYHTAIREMLKPAVKHFQEIYGGKWRICIDSAPLAERYWAIKSGIGIKGKNGNLIIEGYGAFCFLAEVLTTIEIDPDTEFQRNCPGCGKCVKVCPGKAIKGDGTINATRCINYLTIEKKSDFIEEEKKLLREGTGYLFGCDLCLSVCPLNVKSANVNPCFNIRNEIRELTPRKVLEMDEIRFKDIFAGSPLNYAGYERLRRNAQTIVQLRDFPKS